MKEKDRDSMDAKKFDAFYDFFSELMPRVRIKHLSPPKDFVFYMISRYPLPKVLMNIIWIVLCIQTALSSYLPILINRLNCKNLEETLKILGKIFIEWTHDDNALILVNGAFYLHLFNILLNISMVRAFYNRGMLSKITSYAFTIFDTLLSLVLAPIIFDSCSILFRKFNKEVMESYSLLCITILTFILQIRATVAYIFCNNYISLSHHPYRNDVYIIYYSYLIFTPTLSLIIFDGIYIQYAYIPLAIISFVFVFSFMYRPHLYNYGQSVSANTSALFNGISLIINSVFVHDEDNDFLIWISFFIIFACFLIFRGLFKYILNYSIRSIKSKEFIDEVEDGRVASYVIGYSTMAGTQELAYYTNIISLSYKFKNDRSFSKHLAICACSIRDYPEDLKKSFDSSSSRFGFNSQDPYFIELYNRLRGPCTTEEMTTHNMCGNAIEKGLAQSSEALSNISDIIFHESTNVLTSNAIAASKALIKTKILALNFIQKYPLSPLSKVFIEALRVLTTTKELNDELNFWSSFNYVSPFASQYPQLSMVKHMKTNPLMFVPKYGNIPNVLDKVSSKTADKIKEFPKKDASYSPNNGPFNISLKKPLYIIAFGILFIVPIVSFFVMFRESQSTKNVSTKLTNGYIMLQNLSYVTSLLPFYTVESIGNNTIFGFVYRAKVFNRINNYLIGASEYIKAITSTNYEVKTTEKELNYILRDFLKNESSLNMQLQGNFTNIFAFHELVFSCYEVILDSIRTNGTNIHSKRYTSENIIQTLVKFTEDMYDFLEKTEKFSHPISDISIFNLTIYVLCMIILSMILIIVEFIQSKKRANYYYASLSNLSKSALLKLRDRFVSLRKTLKGMETYFDSPNDSNDPYVTSQIRPFSMIRHVIIPVICFAVFGSTMLIFSFVMFKCYSSSSLNKFDITRFMTKFAMNVSKVAAATHSTFFNYTLYDRESIIQLANESKMQIYNNTETQYQCKCMCTILYKMYSQIFSYIKTADLETIAGLYLTNSINFFELLQQKQLTQHLFQKLTALYYDYIFLDFEKIQELIIGNAEKMEEVRKPWMHSFFIFYIIACFVFYMLCLRALTIGDIPYKYLNDLVSSLEIVDSTSKAATLLDQQSFVPQIKKQKLSPVIYSALRSSLTSSVIILDYQMNIVSYNAETYHIFVEGQTVEGVPIMEALKSNYVERGQKLQLRHIIDQYFYQEVNTIRSFEIEDVNDSGNTYDLLCIPLYIDNQSTFFRRSQGIPNLILIFNENKEAVELKRLIKSHKELPAKVMNDWMHPKISKQFAAKHNFPLQVCDTGLFAVIHLFGLDEISNGDLVQTIEGINRIFRRFDMVVASHSMLTKFRSHSSMYALGTDVFAPPNIIPSVTMEFLICLSDLIDETARISASKKVKLSIKVGASIGQIVAGLPGPQHPWLECWGSSVQDALLILSHGQPNSISVSPKIIESAKDLDHFFKVTCLDNFVSLEKLKNK